MKKLVFSLVLLLVTLSGFASPPAAGDVFQLSARVADPNALVLEWKIAPGYLLYKNSLKIEPAPNSNFTPGTLTWPESLDKKNPQGQHIAIYRDQIILPVPVSGKQPGESLLTVYYQGCSDEGFCYPPQQEKIKLTFNNALALQQVSMENQQPPAVRPEPEADNELEQLFSDSSWSIVIFSFFGFGLLLSFTPCVLPMIPVLSGIIVGHGAGISTRKAFFLSLSYVLSMSVTYSMVGAAIAFMGQNLQLVMQSPWTIGIFSLLFVLLALSMFNVYELKLPDTWQNKLASITRSQHGGHYLSAAIMGCLSILILSPCVTAPLIGALGYIAHEGSVSLGILSLFFLGLGMGTPLLLIGTSAGKLLPRAGQWMNEVKAFFGVMMLGVAIYLASRLLPSVITMGLWACLLIFSGIYMGAFTRSMSRLEKFNQGAGLILVVYGFLILIGASQGHDNPLMPLKETQISKKCSQKITVKSLTEAQLALNTARLAGKPVMMDFYADWCASCKAMAATTLQDPKIKKALKQMVVVIADLSPNDADSRQLLNYFHVIAPPALLFFNSEGDEIKSFRLSGEVSVSKLLGSIANVQKIPLL